MHIVTTTGHSYDTVGIVIGDLPYIVYRVADITTGQFVGYVGSAYCGNELIFGPLSKTPGAAYCLANQCAYNRAIKQQENIRALVNSL